MPTRKQPTQEKGFIAFVYNEDPKKLKQVVSELLSTGGYEGDEKPSRRYINIRESGARPRPFSTRIKISVYIFLGDKGY